MGRLEEALTHSSADETELVWLESSRHWTNAGQSAASSDPNLARLRETTVFVRVLERGRLGSFRTLAAETGDLERAIRQAVAQSRSRDTLPGLPHFPADSGEGGATPETFDPAIAELDAGGAARVVGKLRGRQGARIAWGTTELLIANSRGLRRRASATDISIELRWGRGPGAGHAATSSRHLADLGVEAAIDRASRRHSEDAVGGAPDDKTQMLLAPEATIRLLDLLNRAAFTAAAYQQGESLLREHLGVQVFDRRIHLRDDGTDPAGLPFPFDFEGTPKQPIDLIIKGAPKTPALDQRQAAVLGLPPTGHAVAGNDAVAQHLFLLPGEDSHAELMRRAEGGILIGWIDHLECFDSARLRFRARARGVRAIEGGHLGKPLPDLVWEDSLARVLSSLSGLGAETVTWSLGGFGAYSAPALALDDIVGLRADAAR